MSTELSVDLLWIPRALGGHRTDPYVGMRMTIRWQRYVAAHLERSRDVECTSLSFDPATGRSSGRLRLVSNDPVATEWLGTGSLIELLDGYRVIAVGVITSGLTANDKFEGGSETMANRLLHHGLGAVAYLKARVEDDDPSPTWTLDAANAPVLRDLGNGLLVSYVLDQGDHLQFLNEQQLADEGLSHDALHDAALANLADAANEAGVEVHAHGAIFAVVAGGLYEASLLLLDDLWEHTFRAFMDGPYAVVVPTRDVLAFGRADDARVLAELRDIVRRVWATADRRLSDRIFVRELTGWTALT